MKGLYNSSIAKIVSRLFASSTTQGGIRGLQKKLDNANRKFEVLTKATNDAIWEWDLSSNEIEWSSGLKSLFGYDSKNELRHRDEFVAKIHSHDRQDFLEEIKRTVEDCKQNWSVIYRFHCSNGTYKYIYDRGFVVYEGRTPVRMIGAMQDIDDRMTAQTEIEKLSMVASKTDSLVVITNAEEKIEWVNDGFVKQTGYSNVEMIGRTMAMLEASGSNAEVSQPWNTGTNERESVTKESLYNTKAGKQLWLKINISPVFNDDDELTKFVMVGTDVTPHKEFETRITAVARELSNIIENANAVIFGIDRNYYVNEWNQYSHLATGYTKNDVLGKKISTIFSDREQSEVIRRSFEIVLKGNTLSGQEFIIFNKNGMKMTLLVSATPRVNSAGEITGLLAVGQDITELTQYRQSLEEKVMERTAELKASMEKEKELAELKSRFVSIASHEFRTPLSSIIFNAESTANSLEEISQEEIKGKLNKIGEQASHMTRLLDDILVMSKVNAGKIKVILTTLNLKEFLESLVEEAKTTVKERRIINFVFSSSYSQVRMDDKLMRNIVLNLLTNAIKFSPADTVVTIAVSDVKSGLQIEVIDQGIGIPKNELDSVFESFQRGSNAAKIQGTGLGLSILKKAVELMNGSIQVRSELQKGSTFTVKIPIE